jgi:hypothetical protein
MASTLKVTDIQHPSSGVSAITVGSDNSVSIVGGALSPQTGFKNRIINGAMTIDQRNAGASVTPVSAAFTLDRWKFFLSQTSKLTTQRNAGAVTPPAGFINYLGVTSSSAYSVLSGEQFNLVQPIEGLNVFDLGWGTAAAQSVTLSFWVRSSLTGTFGGSLANSAYNRSYPFSYSIAAANTWEQKTITVAGDTAGTWLTTNGVGIFLSFGLGVGSTLSGTAGAWAAATYVSATGATSVVGTSGATFYITGVQLEKGSVATPFEFRSIGTEFGLCQRYYQRLNSAEYITAFAYATNRVLSGVSYTNSMRTTPTATIAANAFVFYTIGTGTTSSAITALPNSSGFVSLDATVTATAGASSAASMVSALQLSAEL